MTGYRPPPHTHTTTGSAVAAAFSCIINSLVQHCTSEFYLISEPQHLLGCTLPSLCEAELHSVLAFHQATARVCPWGVDRTRVFLTGLC